jgi:hypothetical protein
MPARLAYKHIATFAQNKSLFGKQEIADHDTGSERHCSLVGDESKLPKILPLLRTG